MVESLVLSRLDYGNSLFCNVQEYSTKRLQKVQNCAASFVKQYWHNRSGKISLGNNSLSVYLFLGSEP